jgi:arylsulfatase A-like enzyme
MLQRGIRAHGLDESTLWIVFGDHGEAFGQHDGNYGHTFQIFDENVRVPLLIAAPGLITRQVHASQIVSLIDVAPTIADLVGREGQEGREGQDGGQDGYDGIYRGRSLLDPAPRLAFFFADYSRRLVGLRDGRFKAIADLDSGRTALYDLDDDPGEQRDISRDHRDRMAWYENNLRAWIDRQALHHRGRGGHGDQLGLTSCPPCPPWWRGYFFGEHSPATISIDDTFNRRVSDLISFDPLVPTGLSSGLVDGTTVPVTRTR